VNTLFINEQHSHLELRREFISSEQAVWVPISNRHCCWTFEANPYGRLLWGAGFIARPQDRAKWDNRRGAS
jgi:hypothetical protein